MTNFLLTCDDGYNAPGLLASKKAVEDLGDVFVYATEKQQSGGGSRITIGKPIKFYQRRLLDGTPCISVDGTPIDTLWLALYHDLKGKKIDLCISGINVGEQISNKSIILSGTCSAAFFAATNGIPSIAIGYVAKDEKIKYIDHNKRKSHDGFEIMFEYHKKVLRAIVRWVLENGMQGADWLNVNIPANPTTRVRVVKTSRIDYYINLLEKKEGEFTIFGYPRSDITFPKETDACEIKDAIVITPCSIDFTHHPSLKRIKRLEDELKLEV